MRYAVYFCPAPGSGLDAFGREWLSDVTVPGIAPERLQVLKANVHRYGWHATLVAPFVLATHATYDDLRQKLVDMARHVEPFELSLQLDKLSNFLVLRPAGNDTTIQALAEQCVRDLNALRAPLTDAAWRRRTPQLDDHERTLFREYGYPYVLDRYRFHMTLSAPASELEEKALRDYLIPKLTNLATTVPTAHVDALTLCRETGPGQNFEQLERIPLSKGHAS